MFSLHVCWINWNYVYLSLAWMDLGVAQACWYFLYCDVNNVFVFVIVNCQVNKCMYCNFHMIVNCWFQLFYHHIKIMVSCWNQYAVVSAVYHNFKIMENSQSTESPKVQSQINSYSLINSFTEVLYSPIKSYLVIFSPVKSYKVMWKW